MSEAMSENFLPLRYPAKGPAGLLLAVNKLSVSHVSSRWSKEHKQNILLIHLNNGRHVGVFEDAANDVLEDLDLGQFVGDWVLDLETDIS